MSSRKQEQKSFDPYWEKWGIGILLLVIITLCGFIFQDFIFQQKLYLFKDNGTDSLVVYLPRWMHLARYLRESGIPMWSFNCGMGQNIFPGQISNPFNLLLLLSGEQLPRCIIYVELIKFLATGIVSYLYFRTIKLNTFAAIIGSLMLVFCGYMMAGSSGWYKHSSLVFFGIFWLLAFEQLYQKKNLILFPLAVILISSSSLFYIYIFTFFLFLYTLLRFLTDQGWEWQKLGKLLLKMAGLGALGLCMNAIFLVSPLIEMLKSPRVSGASNYFNKLATKPMFGLADPLEYLTILLRSFSTDIFGTGEKFFTTVSGKTTLFEAYQGWHNHFEAPLFYCSIPALLLMPQLFAFLKKNQKKYYFGFLAIWVFLLAFPFFRYALYLFSGDYYKGGINFFIPVILVFMAMQALQFIDQEKKLNIPLLAGTAVVLLMLLYLPSLTSYHKIIQSGIRLTATILILAYTGVIFLLSQDKYRNTGKIAFICLLAGELACFTNITINHRNALDDEEYTSKCGYNDYTVEALADLKANDQSFYRIQKDYVSVPTVYINLNDSQMQDFYGITSYNSFNQKYYIAFIAGLGLLDPSDEVQTRWAMGLTQSPVMQSFTGVKYGLARANDNHFKRYGFIYQKNIEDVKIYRNPLALPLGFTCNRYILASNFTQLDSRQKGFGMMKAFVIPDQEKSLYEKTFSEMSNKEIPARYTMPEYIGDVKKLSKHQLKLTQFSQNQLGGTITLPAPAMLILSIPYDQGWQATVNDKKAPIRLVDFGLMGLPLSAGQHQVELTYRPPHLGLAIFISLLGIGGYIALIIYRFRKRSSD